jgi:hypothetical protein
MLQMLLKKNEILGLPALIFRLTLKRFVCAHFVNGIRDTRFYSEKLGLRPVLQFDMLAVNVGVVRSQTTLNSTLSSIQGFFFKAISSSRNGYYQQQVSYQKKGKCTEQV